MVLAADDCGVGIAPGSVFSLRLSYDICSAAARTFFAIPSARESPDWPSAFFHLDVILNAANREVWALVKGFETSHEKKICMLDVDEASIL